MSRRDLRRRAPRGEPPLSAADRAALEQIEALYGPITRTAPATEAAPSDAQPRKRRRGLAGSLLRTLLLASTAFLLWYALAGGEASVQRTIDFMASRAGTAATVTEIDPTPEQLLAARTMRVHRVAPDDPLLVQFRAVLEALAPKCKETPMQLATAVIDAHAAGLKRGIEAPMLSILAQVNASLPEDTRSSWPTSCAALIARL